MLTILPCGAPRFLALSFILSNSSEVRRKWPRWLVANWSSCPSFDLEKGTAITPALFTRMFRSFPDFRNSDAKCLTDANEVKSKSIWVTFAFAFPG